MHVNSAPLRILLVDDEPMLLSALRRHIERVCPTATVVYALNPQSAVWQLQNTSIALVFTDMRMEGRDDAGWEVVDVAQELDVPVVVVTGGEVDDKPRKNGRRVQICRKQTLNRKHVEELLEPALGLARAG